MKQPPATGQKNYQYLTSVKQQENTRTFKDFLPWYNNKHIIPALEAMQKMVDFKHNKRIDMLKLGCTLQNPATNCLHKSTTAKFYPLTENDKDILEKIRKDMVGGSSFVFTLKVVVHEIFIPDSINWCKSIVGIDAGQLNPFSMCQAMPTGLYMRWELDSESANYIPCHNKTRSLENMVLSYFQRVRPQCKVENFYTTSTHKKN